MQDSVDEPCALEVLTISYLAETPAALDVTLDAFEVEGNIADAFDILQQRIPFFPLSELKFPDKVSECGSFLGGVLGRSSETSLLTLPPKAAALGAFLLLSRVNEGDFSARVGPVTSDIRRLVSAERDTTGPIPLGIRNSPVLTVAVGVVQLLDTQA